MSSLTILWCENRIRTGTCPQKMAQNRSRAFSRYVFFSLKVLFTRKRFDRTKHVFYYLFHYLKTVYKLFLWQISSMDNVLVLRSLRWHLNHSASFSKPIKDIWFYTSTKWPLLLKPEIYNMWAQRSSHWATTLIKYMCKYNKLYTLSAFNNIVNYLDGML